MPTLFRPALLLALLSVLCGGPRAIAQTEMVGPNAVGFALAADTVMETEGSYRVTVSRVTGYRGKIAVDVIVKTDPSKAVGGNFVSTNLVFNDYQLSASFMLAIVDLPKVQTNDTVITLALTNAVLLAGQNPALAPTIAAPRKEMKITVADDDKPEAISFTKVNFQGEEHTNAPLRNVTFTVKLAGAPAADDLAAISVDYTVRAAAGIAELAPGADLATLTDDPDTNQEDERDIPESFLNNGATATGTLNFNAQGLATLVVPVVKDDRVEFDEEFIVTLSNAKGQLNDPASTNMPPDRISYLVNSKQSVARGRILFNTNYLDHPMPAGSVDQRFNRDNVPPLHLRRPGANGPVTAVAVDYFKTNYYVAGNFTAVNAITRHGLARLTPTGDVDLGFSPALNVNGPVTSVDVYRNGPHDGQVVIGGGFTAVSGQARSSVARYLPDGALDPSFAIGLGANGPVYAVKVEGDNSILIAGAFTTFDGVPRGRIARLMPDGKLDTTTFNGPGANGPIFDLAVQVAQPFSFAANRTNETNFISTSRSVASHVGILELTYNNFEFTNKWTVTFGGAVVYDQLLKSPFTVTVNTNDNTTITNYNPTTIKIDLPRQAQLFNNLVITVTPVPLVDTNAIAWDFRARVTPLGTTSIAAVGDFTTFDQVPVNRVIRTDDLGNVDAGFASNIGTGASGPVLAADFQSDGSLIVGGTFETFNSQLAGNIARLTPFGAFDDTFASGTGANGAIRDIFVEKADRTRDTNRWDKIYIGGDFTLYNTSRRIFLARLHPGGYLDTSFMDSAFNQFAGFPSTSGFAPDGTIAAVTVGQNPDPLVGGIFDLVGGGTNRAAVKPRQNFARLVGGETPGPGNFTFDSKIFGGDEDGQFLTINWTLTNQAKITPVALGAFRLQTKDQSATAGFDYKDVSGTFTSIDRRTNNWFFEIPLFDDQIIEGDEEFLIDMPSIIGYYDLAGEPIYPEMAFGPIQTATGRIVENDVPPAVFSFSNIEYNVDENNTATVEIFRSGNASDRVTVQFSALVSTNSNAAGAGDFTTITNQIITFPSGVTNVTITVPIRDDQVVEVDETVALLLGAPSTGSIVNTNQGSAVLNIIDNDLPSGKIDFSLGGFTVVEGEVNAIVTAVRSGGNVGFITVDYETVPGSALAADDYLSRNGQLRWNDRDITPRTILIPIVNDVVVETNETFTVRLLNPSQAGVVGTRHPTAAVVIHDNDFFGDLSFSASEYFADENGGGAIIQVVRRNGSAGSVTVTYSTSPGSIPGSAAVPGKDYNNITNTLTFSPGETAKTFVVPILDDADADGTREVMLHLSNVVNGRLGDFANALLSIVDNETENVPAGGVDTDFVPGAGANSSVNVVAIDTEPNSADRKILVAGDFTLFDFISRERIARLNNDGSLDRNFAVNTKIDGAVRAMLVLPDGKIIIAGHFAEVDGASTKHLARLNTVGRLDTSFQPGAGPDNPVYALAQTFAGDPTNNEVRILLGGDFVTYDSQPRQRIAMIRPEGTLDPNFDVGFGPNGSVYAIAVQRDQKILIGGDFDTVDSVSRSHIARLNPDGSLDLTFDPGLGFNGTVRSIAVQADDKILVGGDFTTSNGLDRLRIARLELNGANDPSFDPGTGADATVSSIVLQPDGKLIVAGDFVTFNQHYRRSVVRLLPNGSIDFSINFGTGPNGAVNSVALQSDRGILIGGDFTEVDGLPRNKVARLFGGSFAGSGALEFAAPVYSLAESAPSATILVRRTGGLEGTISATYQTSDITATAGKDYEAVTDIVTFQTGEMFRTITIPLNDDFEMEEEELFSVQLTNPVGGAIGRQPVTTVLLQSDDSRISLADPVFVANENTPGGRAVITLVREGVSSRPITVMFSTADITAKAGEDYTAVSTPITFAPGETSKLVAVPLVDDNLVEGSETVNLRLQLVTQGPDVSLGIANATLTISDNDSAPGSLQFAQDVSVNEDAQTVTVTVTRTAGKLGTVSVRYTTEDITATAGRDYTAQTGIVTFQQTDTSKTIAIQIRDDTEVEGNETFRVTLTDPTNGAEVGVPASAIVTIIDTDFGPGSLDQSFKIGEGADGVVNSLALQSDGKILVGGDFTDFDFSGHPNLVRLLSSGTVDTNFVTGSGPAGPVYDIALGTSGRITIGGDFRSISSIDRPYVARLMPSGSIDSSMTLSPGLNAVVFTLAAQPDEKVVLGGDFTSPANRAGRLLIGGGFDVSFNVGAGADNSVLDAQVQPDGKVLLVGRFTQFGSLPRGRVVRVLENGLVDPFFNTSVGANNTVWSVVPMAGGKALIGGEFTTVNGRTAVRVTLLNNDGSVDTTFNVGTNNVPRSGPDGPVYAMALQADGKILIGGDFEFVNGEPRNNIARLNTDGSLDTEFNPGLGPNGPVKDIKVQPDQRIVIAGAFTEVNGFPRAGVARLNSRLAPPIVPIKIVNSTIAGSDLLLTFQSQPGVSYDVEATTDLGNPNWTVVADEITASGSTTQVRFPMTANYQFFRVTRTSP
ncbi:MAG TPA: Calx-beta domain-containing protein [Verrucomicrobiae bacterium]|nr:Calx-beta domain-containing protein [Verrucomicrobiae bacterium]